MGLRFRKSIRIGKGLRINLNSKSTSVTFGGKGLSHTISSTGKSRTTVSLPGTGLSYSVTDGPPNKKRTNNVEVIRSEKDKKTALLLCIFGGFLGLHRFYVGKALTGVIWLFSAGLLCMGWIYDVISIARGSFTDGKGHVLM